VLFRGLLLFLGEGEALSLFAAGRAFLNIISTLAVSHKTSTLTHLSRRSNSQADPPQVPSTFAALRFSSLVIRHASFGY
jgi:hypothetical protein